MILTLLLLQGIKVWEVQFAGRPSTGTPAVEFGRVFMTDESGHITCLDAADGKKLWKVRHGSLTPRTPVVVGGRVVFSAGKPGRVFCLRASDGTRLWETELPADAVSPAGLFGDRVTVSTADGTFHCLGAKDGKTLWTFPLGKKAGGMAVAEATRLYVPGGEDGKLHCLDAATGKELWSWTGKGAVGARPALAGGRLFATDADGTLACLDPATGKALWSRDIEVASWPTAADGRLYFGRGDASAVALDLDGKPLWEKKCGNEVYSSPTAVGGKIYFGCFDKKFYALDAATGKQAWSFEAPTPLSGSTAVVGGRLYFADRGRALYCLDAGDPRAEGWPMAGGPLPAAVTVYGRQAGISDIIIRASPRMAGAIDSLTWNGKEFIDRADHGRCLQSAANFNEAPETFNPTEAGSMFDGAGERSTSVPLHVWTNGCFLQTRTRAAFWLRPGESSGGKPAANTTTLSDHIISKRVTVNAGGFRPHAIEYVVTFTVPPGENHRFAQFEAVTGYMPTEFSRFLFYDPETKTAKPLSDGPGEQPHPVILSTDNGSHAMGIYSSEPSPGYGRFRFKDVVKWNCVFRLRAERIEAKDYTFRCFVIVGSLDDVTQTLAELK